MEQIWASVREEAEDGGWRTEEGEGAERRWKEMG